MLKKILFLFLTCALLAASFAGCQGASGNDQTATPTAANTAEATATPAATAPTPTEVPLVTATALFVEQTALNKGTTVDMWTYRDSVILEKLNLQFEYTKTIPSTSLNDQLALMFVSGDYPNYLYGLNTSHAAEYAEFLIDYNDYWDKIPNYVSAMTEAEWDEAQRALTNSFGSVNIVTQQAYQKTSMAWVYNKTALDALNLEFPATADDLFDVLTAIKQDNPDAVPIPNRWGTSTFLSGFALMFRTQNGFWLDNDTGEIEYGPETDKYRDMLIYVRKLYKNSLVDLEFPTTTDEQWAEYYATGRAYMQYEYATTADVANNYIKEHDPDAKFVYSPTYIKAYDTGALYTTNSPVTAWGHCIASNTEQETIDRLLEMINWMCSEDGQLVCSFGEEGVTYEMVDGLPKYTDDIYYKNHVTETHPKNVGLLYNPIWHPEAVELMVGTIPADLEKATEGLGAVLNVYWGFTEEENDSMTDSSTVLNDTYQTYVLNFIMGDNDPADDAQWNAYLAALESAGLSEIKTTYTTAYERSYAD